MYSLQPTANTPPAQPAPVTTLPDQKAAAGPQMWFNPQSQRWISTSCRKYREILRDRALVSVGLPPGPAKYRYSRETTAPPKIYTRPTQHRTTQQNIIDTHQQPTETLFEVQGEEVEDEEQKKTNALWKRYGF